MLKITYSTTKGVIGTKNIEDWAAERIGKYPREFLLNLPIACHGCRSAYLSGPDRQDPPDMPDVELDFLDLELVCPILAPEILETLRCQTRSKTSYGQPFIYPALPSQPQLFQLPQQSQVGKRQLQLFRARPEGKWSEWVEDFVMPHWFCISDDANGYLVDCEDEFDEFMARIKNDPNGCRWFKQYRK